MADLERGYSMKRGKKIDPLRDYSGFSTEAENYGLLKTAILFQAISDYTAATKALYHSSSSETWMRHWRKMRRECIDFFTAPIYDYGDVDTRKVMRLLDEEIAEDLCV